MTALDDAIAAHAAHPAAALADPLTELACDCCCTATQAVPLREGWEHEPADPPHPWWLYAVALVLSIAAWSLVPMGFATPLP